MNSNTHLHIPNADTVPLYETELKVEDLLSGTLVVGEPGSGKTRGCVRPLLRALLKLNANDAERKAGMLVIDGKGGELKCYLEEALRLVGRSDDLIVVGPCGATFNPFANAEHWTDGKIAASIIESINSVGAGPVRRSVDPFWDNASLDILSALVGVARNVLNKNAKSRGTFHVGHLAKLRSMLSQGDAEVVRTAADLAVALPEEIGASLVEFAALPSNTRHSVSTGVGTILAPFSRSPLRDVLIPDGRRPEVELSDILNKGKVVLLDTADAQHASELLPAALLTKTSFARMILSRRRSNVNQTRPVFVVLEEFQRIATAQTDSPACEANWMDTCRWTDTGVILTTQSVSSLLAKLAPALTDQIVSLCGTQMWLRTSDPASNAYAARVLPGNLVHHVQRTISVSLPPPLLFPRDLNTAATTENHTVVPVSEPPSLASLKPGEIHLRRRDGTVHVLNADLSEA